MARTRTRSTAGKPDVVGSLEQARAALVVHKYPQALAAAVAAWRACRVPRLAELVDRISARIERPAITGATVAARTQAWRRIAKQRDPADLARLLATPWPGMPKPAAMQLHILAGLAADPRIAQAFARELAAARRLMQRHNRAFLNELIDRVVALADTRAIDVLDAEWRLHENRWAAGAAEGLRATAVPTLPEEAAALAAALEALVPAVERAPAPDGDAMLAAIYADPDDLAARAVYGDWLQQQGDPRGELIGLQLGVPSDASERRCAQLIAAHGAEWAGALDGVLEKAGRVFEHGFLAAGRLDLAIAPEAALPDVVRDPAWSTVRELEMPAGYKLRHASVARLLELPWARRLRAIRGLEEPMALALLTGPPRPALRELAFYVVREGSTETRAAVAEGRSLMLDRLAVHAEVSQIGWLLESPLAAQLQRFTLVGYKLPLGTWIASVTARGHAIDEIAVEETRFRDHAQWRLIARRDGDGRYTRVHGESMGVSSVPSARELADALATFAPDALTELAIAEHRTCSYSEREIERVERALVRFTRLATVRVPWSRVEPAATAPATQLQLSGTPLTRREQLAPLLARIAEPPLGIFFDGYKINRGAHRPLSGDPVDAIVDAFARKHTRDVALYRIGASETCRLELTTATYQRMRLLVPLADDPARADEYLAWVERLLAAFPFSGGGIPFGVRPPQVVGGPGTWQREINLRWPYQRGFGWFTLVDTPRAWLPPAQLVEIAARHPWIRVVRKRERVGLVLGASPQRPPTIEQVIAFEREVAALVLEVGRTQRAFDLFGLVDELVVPAAARIGFATAPSSDPYARAFGTGDRTFRVGLAFDTYDPELACTATRGRESRVIARLPIEDLRSRIAQIASRMDEVAVWLANP